MKIFPLSAHPLFPSILHRNAPSHPKALTRDLYVKLHDEIHGHACWGNGLGLAAASSGLAVEKILEELPDCSRPVVDASMKRLFGYDAA